MLLVRWGLGTDATVKSEVGRPKPGLIPSVVSCLLAVPRRHALHQFFSTCFCLFSFAMSFVSTC